ncbi:MAG: energy-coupled thiamine transporter ThiT [Oscillospiraceae bacterium]|nr:energy-coupled thiamine transporter ThiT [Oscillospiraceae bacterium]
MKLPSEMSRTQILVECALMTALSAALSMIPGFSMPYGGTVSWFSTLPVILASLRHGARWGVPAALAYSLTQLLLGMSNVVAVPAKTAGAMALCAVLDYVAAYTAIGFTGAAARAIKTGGAAAVAGGIAVTGAARFLCSVMSGVLIWGEYTPEGMEVLPYSLLYNAAWCLPDVIIVMIGALLLSRVRQLALRQSYS